MKITYIENNKIDFKNSR